ncbi:MAG: hypothetical protein V4659_01535 [Pseudomonadota bacterium]
MKFALLLLALALTACGKAAPLKPAAGNALPAAPYGARATPTAERLLTPAPETRPERSDELLKRSSPRETDEFDLPPE